MRVLFTIAVTLLLVVTTAGAPTDQRPTLFVIGDSTANNNSAGAQGWGDPFVQQFDQTRIKVLNRARAGRSSRTFLTEGLWEKVLQEIKAGDFVLIQFGHNDGGPLDTGRARGSLPGTGEDTKEITMPDGRKEVVQTYGWYLRRFISDTRSKAATPIVLTLTVRNIWKDGKVERGSGRFREWAKQVAQDEDVAFLDLTALVADEYEKLGQEKVQTLFAGDHTHTSPEGAELNAALVAAGVKGLKNCQLCKFLRASLIQVRNSLLLLEEFSLSSWESPTRQRACQNRPIPSCFRLGGFRRCEINC